MIGDLFLADLSCFVSSLMRQFVHHPKYSVLFQVCTEYTVGVCERQRKKERDRQKERNEAGECQRQRQRDRQQEED